MYCVQAMLSCESGRLWSEGGREGGRREEGREGEREEGGRKKGREEGREGGGRDGRWKTRSTHVHIGWLNSAPT